jgi:SAM-dependent methyltransferase
VSGDGAQTFRTAPAAYDRYVGRYSPGLAQGLIELAGIADGDRVLDVGCGTGLLTLELAAVVGAPRVCAVDPSEPFLDACRQRVPGADARVSTAESLPFGDADFDAVLSQLSLNFMSDAGAGVREMRRVTRPGGVVAACVWDYAGEMTLLRTFWDAAVTLDAAARVLDEGVTMADCRPARLGALWEAAGLQEIGHAELRPSVRYASFDELWRPITTGVGPAGAYAASLNEADQEVLRAEVHRRLGRPDGPFVLTARAWAVVGRR